MGYPIDRMSWMLNLWNPNVGLYLMKNLGSPDVGLSWLLNLGSPDVGLPLLLNLRPPNLGLSLFFLYLFPMPLNFWPLTVLLLSLLS